MSIHTVARSAAAPNRPSLSLDGDWDFRFVGRPASAHAGWRTASVPAPWPALFDDLRMSHGTGTYRRTVYAPAELDGEQLVLRFGAVNYLAQILVDGAHVATHEGGWLPFEVILPASIRPGSSFDLEVRATLPDEDAVRYPDMPFSEIPHGKQSWYGPLGGIWQSVTLEARPLTHIATLRIVAAGDGTLQVRFAVSGAADGDAGPDVSIVDTAGVTVVSGNASQITDGSSFLKIHVPCAHLWSPDEPTLYTLVAKLPCGDTRVESFGFRSIEARDGRLLLNGKPIYLRSALDQDYYPGLIATPPSLDFIEDQFRQAKAFGLNSLRIHIKVPDPRYYEAADRLGLLIWSEVPNHAVHTPRSAARHRATMEGIVERDFNHPSIIAWSILNEDWGTELAEDPAHRAWLRESYDHLKRLDPTRLVVDNSPCAPNFHVVTDIDDYHWYRGQPDQRAEWDRLTDEFAERAAWSFTPNGDGTRSGSEPLIVSEFGNWGLPLPGDVPDPDGSEPWWFETGHDKSEGVVYPHGWEHRFEQHALDEVFGSLDAFARAAQWHQYEALKYAIESMRLRSEIQGYVITEFTDCHWECNGLLDMRRNPRLFRNAFAKINADTVVVPRPIRWSAADGEALPIRLTLAHGGSRALPAGTLVWSVDGEEAGRIETPSLSGPGVVLLGLVSPVLRGGPRMACIAMELRGVDGVILARNHTDIAVLRPRLQPSTIPLACDDAPLAALLRELGHDISANTNRAGLVVTRNLGEAHYRALAEGRNVLVAADHPAALGDSFVKKRFPRLQLVPRKGSPWLGEWASSFGWLRRTSPFADLPGDALLGLPFDAIVPQHVLVGLRTVEFAGHVQAGLAVGWVQRPAATLATRSWGAGRLVMSTFGWPDVAAPDPMAVAFADALIAHAAEPGPSAMARHAH